MTKQIITVTQAFSKQGLGVVYALLDSGKFKVRTTTSRKDTEEGEALKKKYGDNVEVLVIQNTKQDYLNAFNGAHGVFLISPTISYEDPDFLLKEINGVKEIVDIAVESKVKHLIFSSLDRPPKEAQEEFKDVLIWTPRSELEDYIKTLPIHSSFVSIGYFYSNFLEYYAPTFEEDGALVFSLPGTPGDQLLPYADALVTPGLAARDLFIEFLESPKTSDNGQHLQIVSEYLSGNQMAEIFQRVTGKKAIYRQQNKEDYLAFLSSIGLNQTGKVLLSIFEYPIKYGYFHQTDDTKTKIYKPTTPTIETYEQFLQHSNWKGESIKDFKSTFLKSYKYL
ncbi:hypothetical protein DFA_03879 [Cavenderia fasciculata]|uniref:NmrA-like domain-containing protein n=1 Tax=Cavenderia fasciculata TaxID=261658 RepID=F4Q0N4_CACFS|nr:uncharacterized protein DFA_03879 [Cavenderia fasciculata]EGG18385.1 hypothetical protein DFA_03879 [Cavenderia fasciculata]|eukprot:XP_004366289.1 hypothetical protein DFA_03879 [Cavenderia fasciculata]